MLLEIVNVHGNHEGHELVSDGIDYCAEHLIHPNLVTKIDYCAQHHRHADLVTQIQLNPLEVQLHYGFKDT